MLFLIIIRFIDEKLFLIQFLLIKWKIYKKRSINRLKIPSHSYKIKINSLNQMNNKTWTKIINKQNHKSTNSPAINNIEEWNNKRDWSELNSKRNYKREWYYKSKNKSRSFCKAFHKNKKNVLIPDKKEEVLRK